jgi:hypothetical protein
VHPTAVEQVFDTWRETTGKPKAQLDDKRRRKIQRALRAYPLDDVLAAVQGWRNDPWPERRRHNDIATLLRDADHIEKFRDLNQQGPGPPPLGKRTQQMVATYEQMRTYGIQNGLMHDGNGLGAVAGDRRPLERLLARPADRADDGP